MRQAPITSYFGPGLVLYLVAELASGRGALEPLGAAIAVAAVLLSLSPLWAGPDRSAPGASKFAWLGLTAGLSLVRYVDHTQMSLAADLAQAIGMTLLGALLVDMALVLPDPLGWPRARLLRRLPLWIGVVGTGFLVASHLPAPPAGWLRRFPETAYLILPPVNPHVTELGLAMASVVALGLRLLRRGLGGSPEMLAYNAWGILGLSPAAALSIMAGLTSLAGRPWSVDQLAPAFAVTAGIAILGHGRLINADRRLQAGSSTRAVVALGITVALLSTCAALLMPFLPRSAVAFGCAVAASLFLGLSVHKALVDVTDVLLAPAHGVLLRALAEATPTFAGVRHLDALASRVLQALRKGSGSATSEPVLYFFDPPLEARIDLAGQPHLDRRGPSYEIIDRLRQAPGELITRAAVRREYVRRPTLRRLLDALVQLDALCVAPLLIEGEAEGALILPRGRRRSALTLEESEALRQFAYHVATHAAVLLAEARANDRANRALRDAQVATERALQLETELKARTGELGLLRAGLGGARTRVTPIAYSEPMRQLQRAVADLANRPAPLLLRAPAGAQVVSLAQRIHDASGRARQPFVVADCAGFQDDQAAVALFGSELDGGVPGYMDMAASGTLLLLDAPALPKDVQVRLATAMAARPTGPGDHPGKRRRPPVAPLAARLLLTARANEGATSGDADGPALVPNLQEHFATTELRVPPLAERQEDLESLVLLAIDRGCRIHGKAPVGLDPEARARLLAHPWPGDEAELEAAIERAVGRCDGRRIQASNLVEVPVREVRAAPTRDPLRGTYDAIERRALLQALRDADGNKSEAARTLGLKRTTFLDKLRRHRIADAKRTPSNDNRAEA